VVEKAETEIIMELMEPLILVAVVEVAPEAVVHHVLVALAVQDMHELCIGHKEINYGITLCIS
jgi:hypothetical protein